MGLFVVVCMTHAISCKLVTRLWYSKTPKTIEFRLQSIQKDNTMLDPRRLSIDNSSSMSYNNSKTQIVSRFIIIKGNDSVTKQGWIIMLVLYQLIPLHHVFTDEC